MVDVISKQEDLIQAKVGTHYLQYSLEDEQVRCDCDFFAKKKYCEHLAAVEYYLKNNTEGKELSDELSSHQETQQETKKNISFGSVFLDGLVINDDDTTKYRLAAHGNQSPYSSDYWWTLKINRLPDDRAYVVRDIKAFLNAVKNEGYYQIGKNYFEPLSLIQFDEASQELIQFLWRVIPDGDHLDVDYILPNHGRNLSLTSGTFEEGINLFNDLYDFSFEHNHQTYGQLIFRPLSGLEDLIQFKVVVHRQSIELIISEKEYQPLFNNAFLFTNGFIYSLNLKQQKILTAIRSLPIEADLAKHLFFDLDDQAKLAASLLDFKELGKVEAPKSFDIRDFKVTFYLELNENREVALHVSFDYGNVTVHSKRELEELPFASHFKHEEKVFRTLEANGFSASFLSYHAPLADKDLYDFFTRTLGQLARLGQVTLSDELEEMRQFEEPQVSVHTKGGLLDISFDFSTVFENDIDDALEALFKNQPYFVNGSGKLVVFDEETQRVSSTLQNLRAKQLDNGHLQLDAISAFQISDLFQGNDRISFSKEFEQLAHDLTHPEEFEVTLPPLQTQLRDYQMTGVRWMSMLDYYGFGGILADDMGLGKTLQTIAFLVSHLKEKTRILILSPSSLIYNWKDEFTRFAPEIDVAVSYGLKAVRDEIIAENHQVVITSYSSFRQDFAEYNQLNFDYLILDEAQVMKNIQTKIAHYLRQFEVRIASPFQEHQSKINSLKFGQFSKSYCQVYYQIKNTF